MNDLEIHSDSEDTEHHISKEMLAIFDVMDKAALPTLSILCNLLLIFLPITRPAYNAF